MVAAPTGAPAPVQSVVSPPGWSSHLGADRTDVLKLGALLVEAPTRKSVVVTVHATAGGELASVVRGLTWSVALGAYYSYYPTERRWLSKEVAFSTPIDHLQVQLLALPSRRSLGPAEVVRVLAWSSSISDEGAHSLHLLKAPSQ